MHICSVKSHFSWLFKQVHYNPNNVSHVLSSFLWTSFPLQFGPDFLAQYLKWKNYCALLTTSSNLSHFTFLFYHICSQNKWSFSLHTLHSLHLQYLSSPVSSFHHFINYSKDNWITSFCGIPFLFESRLKAIPHHFSWRIFHS